MARADTYTQSDLTKDLYSDFMNDLTPHPNTNSIVLLKNVNAVSRSIKNLILTNKYERPYNPKIGSNIRAFLFEPADAITEISIKENIKRVIKKYEPRVAIRQLIINDLPDQNAYKILVNFKIKEFDTNQSVEIILRRLK